MFYDIYCELCKKNGLTPGGAAAKIGFNRASVTVWKNSGRAPKEELLLRIANFFHVSVDYLLGTEKASTISDEHDILDDIDVAFYGDYKALTEDDKETLRAMARVMAERQRKKKPPQD